MINLLPKGSAEDVTTKMLTCRLWISCYDLDEDASEMAEEIWRDLSFTTSGSLCFELLVSTPVGLIHNSCTGNAFGKYSYHAFCV